VAPLLLLVVLQAAPQPPRLDSARVYRVRPGVDVPITLGASVTTLLAYLYADHLITPYCPCDPRGVNAFDRGAIGNTSATARRLSDATAAAALGVPLVLDAIDLGPSEALMNDAIVFAQTWAINGLLVGATKIIVHRPLPRTYAGDSILIGKPEGYRSFYSGHTSSVFAALSAAAMTIRLRYGEKTWPWVVTALVGTSVGIERVADGRHFPSDVIVGAVMGTATGILVPSLHARRRAPRISPTVAPVPGGGVALSVTYRF
jgi:membrane-associated phospholipid phosphatase